MSEAEFEAGGVSKRFDPRFSPAFQPGYDPRVHREEPPTRAFRDELPSDRGGMISEAPSFAVPASDGRVDREQFSAGRGASQSATLDIDAELLAWWQRINPWFLVLWLLGVIFIAGGVGLIVGTVNSQFGLDSSSGGGQLVFMFLQSAWIASPMLITLGLATITSTVVIQAAKWRSRSSTRR